MNRPLSTATTFAWSYKTSAIVLMLLFVISIPAGAAAQGGTRASRHAAQAPQGHAWRAGPRRQRLQARRRCQPAAERQSAGYLTGDRHPGAGRPAAGRIQAISARQEPQPDQRRRAGIARTACSSVSPRCRKHSRFTTTGRSRPRTTAPRSPSAPTAVRQLTGYKGNGVGVAVIDSGVASWHDDLTIGAHSRPIPTAISASRSSSTSSTAGRSPTTTTATARTSPASSLGNGYDSAGEQSGIAPEASLVSLKVLDKDGKGTISNIIAALDWVVANRQDLQHPGRESVGRRRRRPSPTGPTR